MRKRGFRAALGEVWPGLLVALVTALAMMVLLAGCDDKKINSPDIAAWANYIEDCRHAGFTAHQCRFFLSRMQVVSEPNDTSLWGSACERSMSCE